MDQSEKAKIISKAIKLEALMSHPNSPDNEAVLAGEFLDKMDTKYDWLHDALDTALFEPELTVNYNKLSKQEIIILATLCGAYNINTYLYGNSKTKRHFTAKESLAKIIKREFKELQEQWLDIQKGVLSGFINANIDMSFAGDADSNSPPWSEQRRAAFMAMYHAMEGAAKKGIGMKRLE